MSEETRIILVNSVSLSEYITITNDFRKLEEEIERINNIINELEKDLKGKIDEDRLNILSNSHWKYILDKLDELKGSNGAIPPEVMGANGEDGGLFDYGDR